MLARRDPFREILNLRSAMDRMFDNSFFGGQMDWPQEFTQNLALDVVEKEDEFLVKASIPGINPDDLDITFANGTLTIQGETKDEQEKQEERYHLRERRYGSFSRSISLPTTIDADHIEANYDKGVLTLRLPKTEEVRPKRIAIQSGQTKVIEAGNGKK
jgi:HSP20 family protein